MWQMVGYIPTTLNSPEDITILSAKLATSFFLESFIHAKEKLNIVQWVECLTKQFDSSTEACGWFLDHMASDTHWPTTIFLKCQVATIRQMYHRLCIHVLQKLRYCAPLVLQMPRYMFSFRPMAKSHYLLPWEGDGSPISVEALTELLPEEMRARIGSTSPVTRFVRTLLTLLDSGAARPHIKFLGELFRFLHDFAKMGEEESRFLLAVNTVATVVDFYLRAVKGSSEHQVSKRVRF